jgi:hypothetical protein
MSADPWFRGFREGLSRGKIGPEKGYENWSTLVTNRDGFRFDDEGADAPDS